MDYSVQKKCKAHYSALFFNFFFFILKQKKGWFNLVNYLLVKKKNAKNWKIAIPVRKHKKKKIVKNSAKKYMGSNVKIRFISKTGLKRLIKKNGIYKRL